MSRFEEEHGTVFAGMALDLRAASRAYRRTEVIQKLGGLQSSFG